MSACSLVRRAGMGFGEYDVLFSSIPIFCQREMDRVVTDYLFKTSYCVVGVKV